MENLQQDFTPMLIGRPDEEKRQKIRSLYQELIDQFEGLKWEYETITGQQSSPVKTVLQLLDMDPSALEISLKTAFIKANNISLPGLNMEKLLKTDLLEMPEELTLILDLKDKIVQVTEKILETSFRFPIVALFNEEANTFSLTEEFEEKLRKHTESWTNSQEQNDILNSVQKFCDALNDLIELKVIRNDGNMWKFAGEHISLSIENQKHSLRPLGPYQKMFQRYPLTRFSQKAKFSVPDKSRSTILG